MENFEKKKRIIEKKKIVHSTIIISQPFAQDQILSGEQFDN